MSRLRREQKEYSFEPEVIGLGEIHGLSLPGEQISLNRYALVQLLAEMGLLDHEIALCLGMNPSSFHACVRKDPELMKALQEGKRVPDRQVEMALFQTALGYNYTERVIEEEIMISKDQENKGLLIETITGKKVKTAEKHQPPNVQAQIFWLKNRLPKLWRDRTETTITLRDRAEIAHKAGGID